jgi:Ni/Fe-hydrogenase subunit HybB-like protein
LILAGILYRLDVYLIAFQPRAGWQYFPSVPEMLVTLGLFALEILLYLVFIKKLAILPVEPASQR